jgi:hypothetical protein
MYNLNKSKQLLAATIAAKLEEDKITSKVVPDDNSELEC